MLTVKLIFKDLVILIRAEYIGISVSLNNYVKDINKKGCLF